MNKVKNLIKTCLVWILLWAALPCPAQGQYYGRTREERYCPPAPESQHDETNSNQDHSGVPWWGWVVICLIVVGWLSGNDNSKSSSPSPSDGGYVKDPSR